MDSKDWHERFIVQASWTKELRQFIYRQTGINPQSRILEIGCGTGVIVNDVGQQTDQPVIGIDIDYQHLSEANIQYPESVFACSEAAELPFPDNSFDFVISHYFFLWVKDAAPVLKEVNRVLKPHGTLVALAEPDYLARIDAPREFWELAELQTTALINQGVNPMMGRQLPQLLSQAGFKDVSYGVSGFQSETSNIPDWLNSEWNVLEHDLDGLVSSEKLRSWRELDLTSRENGSRVLWVPTFYAFGNKTY